MNGQRISITLAPGLEPLSVLAPTVRTIVAPKSVFMVGNSFTYDNGGVHSHILWLIQEAEPGRADDYFFRCLCISGALLCEHRPGFAGHLRARNWDAVVLQGNSLEPLAPNTAPSFAECAGEYAAAIRSVNASPVFFMTWAYADKPEMTLQLADSYTIVANDNNALAVPVGLAFAASVAQKNRLGLIKHDDKHPTTAGTYLAACVFYSAFYRKSPVGLAHHANLWTSDARFLQKVAWETTAAFYDW